MKKLMLLMAVACLCSLPALADTITITGPATGSFTGSMTFDLDANPTPDSFSLGNYFHVGNVTTSLGVDSFYIYNSADGGLLQDTLGLNIFGAQLYTGSEDAPTLITGTFVGSQGNNGLNQYTVEITNTPEPGSLFLLGSGLIGLGGTIRRKLIA